MGKKQKAQRERLAVLGSPRNRGASGTPTRGHGHHLPASLPRCPVPPPGPAPGCPRRAAVAAPGPRTGPARSPPGPGPPAGWWCRGRRPMAWARSGSMASRAERAGAECAAGTPCCASTATPPWGPSRRSRNSSRRRGRPRPPPLLQTGLRPCMWHAAMGMPRWPKLC